MINIIGVFLVFKYYEHRGQQFSDYCAQILHDLEPRIVKDCIQHTEYCFVCNGNGIKPASIEHNMVSIHRECKKRMEKGEIQIKYVGETPTEERVNLVELINQKSYRKLSWTPDFEKKKVL